MQFPGDPTPFLLIVAVALIARMIRGDRHLVLTQDRFWNLVQSQDRPVVLLTTRGWFVKRMCYVFPYQGVLFYTSAKGTSAPDGVKLIGTGAVFSL